jgi:hypothetical protein
LSEDETDFLAERLSPGGGTLRAFRLAEPYINGQRDAITQVIVSTVLESAGTAPSSVATEQPDGSPTQQP